MEFGRGGGPAMAMASKARQMKKQGFKEEGREEEVRSSRTQKYVNHRLGDRLEQYSLGRMEHRAAVKSKDFFLSAL